MAESSSLLNCRAYGPRGFESHSLSQVYIPAGKRIVCLLFSTLFVVSVSRLFFLFTFKAEVLYSNTRQQMKESKE